MSLLLHTDQTSKHPPTSAFKPVDYESRSSYSFSVEVLNPIVDPRFLRRGPFKDRASIRVAVLMQTSLRGSPDPDTIWMFLKTARQPALWAGFSIDPQSDPEALFRITPDTGLITTAMELDRERDHWHNITVIATQRGQRSLSLDAKISLELSIGLLLLFGAKTLQ
ncbi:hypothetical protein F7725_011822 [Dissostichus mawsoni]|uniref:Cadherin domain-containing protein n=1 Tax=Dissostichus mawsoni TaxID=36200 RepID=A0A7J5ZBX1_DISMA|nr:hypothetical protein F7725_011822 [Dissostichus mawsoni]